MFVFPRSHPNISWQRCQSGQSAALGADSKSCEKGKDAGIHPDQSRQTVEHCKINWPWLAQCYQRRALSPSWMHYVHLLQHQYEVECNDSWSTAIAATLTHTRLGFTRLSVPLCCHSMLYVLPPSRKRVTHACSWSHPADIECSITIQWSCCRTRSKPQDILFL